jgi:MoaA/NifB/PqqE/SkfB family radical SAM enzyme
MSTISVAKYRLYNGKRAFDKWIIPYIQSRVFSSSLRPVLSYLYTDWKCNINCHYCFQFNNNGKGMSYQTATSAIDWLKTIGCRAIPLMGGEPLIRKDFILDVVRYGAKQGFFVYLPTNGYLLTPDYIDKLGDAGIAAINLAVDCVAPKTGLPKALKAIEPQFKYLVENQEKYGYLVFFNMNITSKNMSDVKILTEIAHDNHIATDYHINEPPQQFFEMNHYSHLGESLYIRPDQFGEVDELLDWIIEKNHKGYNMVNSIPHLQAMKDWIRNKPVSWQCRAGKNGIMIRPDGSITPCFGLLSYDHDWGRIWDPKIDMDELAEVKKSCFNHCLSTCFYTMSHYYHPTETLKWMMKHMRFGGQN